MTPRPEVPGPLKRRGPRPLLLHLTLAMLRSNASRAMSPLWNADWRNSSVEAILRSVQDAVRDGNPDRGFPEAVLLETLEQDAALIEGIAAYRRHPGQRSLEDPPAVWAEGGSRLLDYGTGGGRPVLFVPSLVNRAYVLDLIEGHSMLRWLAARGVRPLLLDWGWPAETERRFTLTDYVAGRLERAMAAAARIAGAPPVLAGYCMGGTLAVAAAQRRPDLISGLALLAAPWDFHAPDPQRSRQAAEALPLLEPALAFSQTLSVDLLQTLFALLDPWSVAAKYRAFARMPQDSERARLFVALEDWVNDGVPLAAEVARACLRDWYGENAPARGSWHIAGLPVEPQAIAMPAFVAIPDRDRIVPPESALPLAKLIPGAMLHQPAAGHIGMAAGARAEPALWRPLLAWLEGLGRQSEATR
ncbi:poly-beta-hydroxybutyrate polymerase [Rhodopila globiformis]|uniref:Poly-beta-hydroxybutyrate polymerase n=1 Tax=Rhodopila globiformis TaxID=1071 RepID=A0A2S6NIL7_RHOGL|nr:poly-beta-hydroxybutyrate polymerase [Rhodopila globiformis]